ncbi:MAG: laccase domain-containing protein, partial [Candidatus Acidiferrales bacterium]
MARAAARPKKKSAGKRAQRRAPESQWRLRQAGKLQILQARPFNRLSWLVHGFSTRPGGVSELNRSGPGRSKKQAVLNLGFTDWDRRERVEVNRRRLQKALGYSDACLVTLRQVHSDVLHLIQEPLYDSPKG